MQQKTIQRIYCGFQNYAWGMSSENKECLVYQLYQGNKDNYKLQITPQTKFAELWMGTHHKLPSLLENGNILNTNLPYLFKVLSIDQPLSIQLHPNKEQAIKLHQQDPEHYPDDNHKPEMAIALTEFQALLGFAPFETILNNLQRNPQIIHLIKEHQDIWNQFEQHKNLKPMINLFLSWDQNILAQALQNYQFPQQCCKQLNQVNEIDVGYLFVLIMNHVTVLKGEAFLMRAGQVHAYLQGNCIEVMANSDNVVRCGFTPKFKDTISMSEIIECTMGDPVFIKPNKINDCQLRYESPYEEFQCENISNKNRNQYFLHDKSIAICIKGEGQIGDQELKQGFVYYVESKQMVEINGECELFICFPKS